MIFRLHPGAMDKVVYHGRILAARYADPIPFVGFKHPQPLKGDFYLVGGVQHVII
jgi:hypothetical protein